MADRFDSFTDAARRVLVLAQEECAGQLAHPPTRSWHSRAQIAEESYRME
jgi:hypothetical protein